MMVLLIPLFAQMLYLDSDDNSKPIYLYINSQEDQLLLAWLYDTIKYVKSDVVTVRSTRSLNGSVPIFLWHKKWQVALPRSRILIHQPLGGTSQRQASDIEIEAEILRIKDMLNSLWQI